MLNAHTPGEYFTHTNGPASIIDRHSTLVNYDSTNASESVSRSSSFARPMAMTKPGMHLQLLNAVVLGQQAPSPYIRRAADCCVSRVESALPHNTGSRNAD